jgi:hypothetical protein
LLKKKKGLIMPLISSTEEKLLQSISAASNGVVIDKFKLKEFAFARAKKAIIRKHPDWIEQDKIDGPTLARLIEINVRSDFERDIQRMVQEFIDSYKDEPRTPEIVQIEEKHEECKREILVREIPETQKDKNIDKVVATGRRTLLHLACESGNYDEVVRLVETCGAKVGVRDASNWTPKDRARLGGHAKITQYLEQFS